MPAGCAERRSRATSQPTAELFPWHEADALTEIFGPHGFTIDVETRELPLTGISAQRVLADEVADHPMWTIARDVLPPGEVTALEAETLAIYTAANTDPSAFRMVSPYVVAHLSRGRR